ncbi:RNI-like protein [Glarea lozoyensis ATCC 20868]|uniref:RNI-like protein n=1 Tax=Glarea lozoyensis (strain ATCC 20868 / MF5171) TaxID=1116229 RepID=S3D4M9_GLAL2|nr:RNI-like protein [Glarea lozoyensis ATCC 20868]EPE32064.1 RNI-like protein [Glarea lozoyensis ATCC 20868]
MATRKSSRLQNVSAQNPVVEEPNMNAVAKKRKLSALASKEEPRPKESKKGAKMVKSKTLQAETTLPEAQLVNLSGNQLFSLPVEVLNMTLDNVKDIPTISALGRTCKNMYTLMMPRLYGRVMVSAPYHAHIAKVIRTLEPHLTIAQKKQLKKEGKYKGQQEKYPKGLNETAIPICASYVKELLVGYSDPGKKHRYIVERYIEEALKNMRNLEIVEGFLYTESIGKSIAALKSLKALSLNSSRSEGETLKPLFAIKNVRHLNLRSYSNFGQNSLGMLTSKILQNSSDTLEGLVMESGNLFEQWDDKFNDVDSHYLKNLKSLSIQGIEVDERVLQALERGIDFIRLRELEIVHFDDTESLLFQHLTNLTTLANSKNIGIGLRTLHLRMSDQSYGRTPEQKALGFRTKCDFVRSFNTLTSLELSDYGVYPSSHPINPGLARPLLEGILKHKHLRTLKIPYAGSSSGFSIPYLSGAEVGALIDGLPELRELNIAPVEAQIDEISAALSKGKNLETITLFPHESWGRYPMPDNLGVNIIKSILKAFLNRSATYSNERFDWDRHCRLRSVSLGWIAWDIASEFEKKRGGKKVETVSVGEGADKRVVYYRDANIRGGKNHDMYAPRTDWVDKVAREMRWG